MLSRRPDESDFQYHRRLIYGKLVDHTLADVDYSELSIPVYGKQLSSDATRKAMYGSRDTIELIERERVNTAANTSGQAIMSEIDSKLIELRKEQQKMFDQRAALNQVIRERARAEEINEMILMAVKSGSLPTLPEHPKILPPSTAGGNDLLISLNDIHYGAVVNNYWCRYNPDICAEMMRIYIDRIVTIAHQHNSENCYVWANGDMISGNIHYEIAVGNRENLVKQVMGVSELIAWFLNELRQYFTHVYFVSVAGNHSRIGQKDKSIMNERLDDLVEWYLRARLQHCSDVTIGYGDKIDTTMYLMTVRGKNYIGVHGDYDPTPSNIQTLQTMAQRPVYAVLLGHKHHNEQAYVQGIRTIMAGSFQGMDSFCIQRRIYGKPQQMVCVCNHDGILCTYDIDLEVNSNDVCLAS